MYLTIKYKILGSPNSAQMPANNSAQGNAGVNFVGTNVALGTMAMTNPTAANNTHQGVIVPEYDRNTDGTYIDKIISITLPALTGTAFNYLSLKFSNFGINTEIIGVEPLGFTRDEAANTAAYNRPVEMLANMSFSVSKNRLIIVMAAAINACSGSKLHLRITYKN